MTFITVWYSKARRDTDGVFDHPDYNQTSVMTGSDSMPDPAALLALDARRSVPSRQLAEPGPDPATLQRMLASAVRVPDHGEGIAGFIHIGTPKAAVPERERPAPAILLRDWTPPA